MMLRFVPPQGSPAQALGYVLSHTDELGRTREVTLVAGSPNIFLAAAGDLPFRHRYQSAVLAWSVGESPNDQQLDQVLDRLFDTMACGLPLQRIAYLAVRHDRLDATDVHVLVAAVDLGTGKHFNPAPPGWQRLFGLLQDWANLQFDWSDPRNEGRQRWIQPARQPRLHRLADTPRVKQVVVEAALDWIETRAVTSRSTLVQKLQEVPGVQVVGVADGRLRLLFDPERLQGQVPMAVALKRCAAKRPVRFQLSGRACLDTSHLGFKPRPALRDADREKQHQDEQSQEAVRRSRMEAARKALQALEAEIERRASLLTRRHVMKVDLTVWPDGSFALDNLSTPPIASEHHHGSEAQPALDGPVLDEADGPIRTGRLAAFAGATIRRVDELLGRLGQQIERLQLGIGEIAQRVSRQRRADAERARAYLARAIAREGLETQSTSDEHSVQRPVGATGIRRP